MILREKWKKLGLLVLTGGLSTKTCRIETALLTAARRHSAQAILTKRRPDDK